MKNAQFIGPRFVRSMLRAPARFTQRRAALRRLGAYQIDPVKAGAWLGAAALSAAFWALVAGIAR